MHIEYSFIVEYLVEFKDYMYRIVKKHQKKEGLMKTWRKHPTAS
jgi:hypothetical protein